MGGEGGMEKGQKRCEKTDTWYLSIGNQPYGRMKVKIKEIF